jgi:hypothetical protein
MRTPNRETLRRGPSFSEAIGAEVRPRAGESSFSA